MKNNRNENLLKTLNDYCFDGTEKDYAIMIDGAWGAGKTFLIDEFFERKNNSRKDDNILNKPLRISLYGVKEQSDIANALYAALHPILSSKGGKLGTAVFRGLLKSTLRVDLAEHDLKGALTVGGINLTENGSDKKTTGRIIVFDDFERAAMPPVEILAAIHPFIETGENKVIIIGNEKEISVRCKENLYDYAKAKEKTIGYTLPIIPEFDIIYNSFLKNEDEAYESFLEHSKGMVSKIIEIADNCNFRILRLAIAGFRLIFNSIECKYRSEKYFDALSEMFQYVLISYIETRSGNTDLNTFRVISGNVLSKNSNSQTHDNSEFKIPVENILKKYNGNNVYFKTNLLDFSDLDRLLSLCTVDKDHVNKILGNDPRFRSPDDMPSWLVILRRSECNDTQLNNAIVRFKKELSSSNLNSIESILHACSAYIKLNSVGHPDFSEMPVDYMKKYIDKIYNSEKNNSKSCWEKDIVFPVGSYIDDIHIESYSSDHYKHLFDYLKEKWELYKCESLRLKINKHSNNTDANLIDSIIWAFEPGPDVVIRSELFESLSPQKVALAIIHATTHKRTDILNVFKRYKTTLEVVDKDYVKKNGKWINSIIEESIKQLPSVENPLRREDIRNEIECIKNILM
ncbi:P-loop NTPase fold protein [Acetobacter orientalis]|uniref:P-loop NTPase fold protein n=1 Tax=Acetobacter orientalis TaxID=146474 RepID=UPI0039E8326D